jgi:DNA-binding protein H-NS
MATLAQLENQIQKLQRRAEVLRERKSAEVIASIRELMSEHGLTTADLEKRGVTGKKRGRPVGSKNVANHAEGKSKLPPKYRDPVSGLTWSGHARPPAWIKDAPDRSVFLINGSANGAGSANGVRSAGRSTVRKSSRKRAA